MQNNRVTIQVDIEVEIPEGYSFVDYREPVKGEMWIDIDGYFNKWLGRNDEKRVIITPVSK